MGNCFERKNNKISDSEKHIMIRHFVKKKDFFKIKYFWNAEN